MKNLLNQLTSAGSTLSNLAAIVASDSQRSMADDIRLAHAGSETIKMLDVAAFDGSGASQVEGSYQSKRGKPHQVSISEETEKPKSVGSGRSRIEDERQQVERYPSSYMEVLEMLERGLMPPGIRSDIKDKPPNPLQPLPVSKTRPPSKPWERKLIEVEEKPLGEIEESIQTDWSQNMKSDGVLTETRAVHISDVEVGSNEDDAIKPGVSVRLPESPPLHGQSSPLKTLADNSHKSPASLFEATAPVDDLVPGVVVDRILPQEWPSLRPVQGAIDAEISSLVTRPLDFIEFQSERRPYDDGHGLGRPSSRDWKPPPMPLPTLPINAENSRQGFPNDSERSGASDQSLKGEVDIHVEDE